jgi:hypothetical protein|tara:strand:+ start:3416 stop:4000 length:585 start_codon:yes stop_codon:yes gene_type:complete
MEQYNQEAIQAFTNTGRPIPGQSLTSNPDEPRPFEGPPDFTNFKEALDYIASELLLEENYMPMMAAIADGVPITDLAMQIGYVGFREGKFNPDLMMMLMEPIMYLLMALAEKAGIEYRIDSEDDDEDEDNMFQEQTNNLKNTIKEKINTSKVPSGVLPSDIQQQIQNLEIPQESLLSKPEQQPEAEQSLLNRGQ